MVNKYEDLYCIIPFLSDDDKKTGVTTTHRLAYNLTSRTCQHDANSTRPIFAKDYPYEMNQAARTTAPATTVPSPPANQTRSNEPQIHKEADRSTNWRRYKSTQITKNKPVIYEDKIYIIYTGKFGRLSTGLYPSWPIASQLILGYASVHGSVKKHEIQRAWRQITEVYPGVTSQAHLDEWKKNNPSN
eukprot:scaffold303397_cov35-Attheya_sp.AAC.1